MYWLSSKWRCGRPERGLSSSRNAVRPFICLTVRQEEIGISSIESMCKPPASCYAGQVLAFQSPVSIQTSRRVPERLNYEVHVAQRSASFFLGLLVCERVFALKCGLKVELRSLESFVRLYSVSQLSLCRELQQKPKNTLSSE
jgi:hypothetical protein